MVRQTPKIDNTLTVKDDGSRTHVKKWTDPGSAPRPDLRATALPAQQPTSLTSIEPSLPGRRGFANRVGMGGFTGGAQYYDMAKDPGWAGVPRPQPSTPNRAANWLLSPNPWIGAAQAMIPGRVQPQHVPRMRGDIGAADSIGMPQVANLRNRVRGIERQQAAIPRQQMPPPRFVPRVDPSQFPTVQDRNTGTYNLGDPGVVMNRGGPSLENLRENVGEDLRGAWNPIRERMQNIIEQIRRKREGQSMAPFEDVSRGTADFLSKINPFWGRQPWH